MTSPHGAARRVLLAGAALIAVAWAVAPAHTPPLYDGLTGPAEAYRYLNPPPGARSTQPPTSASTSVGFSGGESAADYLTTSEQPPQAQFLVGQGSLAPPAGTASITLSVKPVPPPAPLPASLGALDGNVYEVTATANVPGAVSVKPGGTAPTIVLRGPPGAPSPQIARYTGGGGSWQALHTVPLSSQAPDMVAANTDQLGFFAMVVRNATPSPGGGSAGGGGNGGGGFPVVAVVVPLAVLAVLGGVVLLIRRSRARTQRPRARRR